jgi:hypothetical protein
VITVREFRGRRAASAKRAVSCQPLPVIVSTILDCQKTDDHLSLTLAVYEVPHGGLLLVYKKVYKTWPAERFTKSC